MDAEWLAMQSFRQNQDLLAAINTLSIHSKLALAGMRNEKGAENVAMARETLVSFLEAFEKVIEQAEHAKNEPLLGVDMRLRQLANSFLAARRNRSRFHSALFARSIADMVSLLTSTEQKDRKALIECLTELRILVEEHAHADTSRILGNF